MRWSLIIFIGFINLNAFAQQATPNEINAIIVDTLSLQPIPFASVYTKHNRRGTISNFQGRISLQQLTVDDTLICTNIGFEKQTIPANHLWEKDTIWMTPIAQEIDAVMVTADDAFLYELVHSVKKTRLFKTLTAKSYFELETFHNQEQLELFQGYYNGTYKGYDVVGGQLKSGRVALAPLGKRVFASLNISKVMNQHQMFAENIYFPTSPFQLKKRKLVKQFKLVLNNKYQSEGKTIYVIGFTPKQENGHSFSGKVWIDSLSHRALKVQLDIDKAETYPFQAIWRTHALNDVSMQLTKTFGEYNGFSVVQSVDFEYTLNYISSDEKPMKVNSRAILYAYDYKDQFSPLLFDTEKVPQNDYRLLSVLPYNGNYWTCPNEFSIEDSFGKNTFADHEDQLNQGALFTGGTFGKNSGGFFEHPYVKWNGNRVFFKEIVDSSRFDISAKTTLSEQYKIDVDLVLDISNVCDSQLVTLEAVLDPYESFYSLEMSKIDHCFINIYFDLMEIQRRELLEKINVETKPATIINLYQQQLLAKKEISEIYFREVQRGTKLRALKKWNDIVFTALKIDNFKLFEISLE